MTNCLKFFNRQVKYSICEGKLYSFLIRYYDRLGEGTSEKDCCRYM